MLSAIKRFAKEITLPNMVMSESGIGSASITNKTIINTLFFMVVPSHSGLSDFHHCTIKHWECQCVCYLTKTFFLFSLSRLYPLRLFQIATAFFVKQTIWQDSAVVGASPYEKMWALPSVGDGAFDVPPKVRRVFCFVNKRNGKLPQPFSSKKTKKCAPQKQTLTISVVE